MRAVGRPTVPRTAACTASISTADRSRWQPSQRVPLSAAAATDVLAPAAGRSAAAGRRRPRRAARRDGRRCRRAGRRCPPPPARAASSATASADTRPSSVGGVGGQVVVDLGLLLERAQLGIVERAATLGQQRDLVHQRLRLAWREHRLELLLEPRPVDVDRVRLGLGARDHRLELIDPALQVVAAAFPIGVPAARRSTTCSCSGRCSRRWRSWSANVSAAWSSRSGCVTASHRTPARHGRAAPTAAARGGRAHRAGW